MNEPFPTDPQPVEATPAENPGPTRRLHVTPVRYPQPTRPSRPPAANSGLRWLLLLALVFSLGFNFLLLTTVPGCGSSASSTSVDERHVSGRTSAKNKIAVVRVEGVIMEGMIGYALKQIEQAAKDEHVKAVVLRINSPGGTITASDDLHRRISQLRNGDAAKNYLPKPIIVSMASLAASGGYYIAMPAQLLMAERTTITGSIGVYASFPNVADLAEKHGVRLDIIKAGRVKDSGSPFHKMTSQERQVWQEMVDHSYRQFLEVVGEGRPQLKGQLESEVLTRTVTLPESGEKLRISRQRADGGIFTSDQALQLGLIDKVGYLEDALKEAQTAAGLGEDYRVVNYDKPLSLLGAILGGEIKAPTPRFDLQALANGATPRLWYLSPQSELAGILAAAGAETP